MSEKHAAHAHGHPAGAEPHKDAPEKPADPHEAHKRRFNHACETVANGIATLKAAGCTPAEAQKLAVELWDKTKAG